MSFRHFAGLLLLLCWLAIPAFAQTDDEAEDEAPVIPYFHSILGFNVPELDGWDNQSDERVARFASSELNARIRVEQNAELTPLTDTVYATTLNLSNGTWEGGVYRVDDDVISRYTLVLPDANYTVEYVDSAPDTDTFQLIIPPADGMTAGDLVESALMDVLNADSVSAGGSETLEFANNSWTQVIYTIDDADSAVVTYSEFGNAIYATIISGTDEPDTRPVDAFNTVFLGFFITLDTSPYLYLGLAATALIFIVLIGSYILRARSAEKDLQTLETIAS